MYPSRGSRGCARLANLRVFWERTPHLMKAKEIFHRQYLKDGLVDPEHAPPLGYAHLTTVAEFRALFQDHFEEQLVAGVESFTGHAQKQWHQLSDADRNVWLDLVEATSTMEEGYGAAEHLLYVGRKRTVLSAQ